MLVQSITEEEIYGIGYAFGYYDYGEEIGMSAAFSGKEATANDICAYVHGVRYNQREFCPDLRP